MDSNEKHRHGLLSGSCLGGPLNGQTGQSRYPRGFVLVDKQGGRAWIYDAGVSRSGKPMFFVREDEGRPLDHQLRIAAAESSDWDVVAGHFPKVGD